MNRVMNILVLLAAGFLSGTVLYCVLSFDKGPKVKVEAPPPLSIHPVSEPFSTGYILVEVWTQNGETKQPHIIRMRRSEYLEWVRPKKHR